MGKCKFNDNRLSRQEFANWLKRVPDDDSEAYCTLCKRTLKLGTLGVRAPESHVKASKHEESANAACSFVKREVLQDITTAQLINLDIGEKNNLMPVHCVDVSLGAEEALKCRHEDFISFKQMQKRLDVFLHGVIGKAYPDLWVFCKKLLLLSHGQASVERGFSVNKEIETENMQEETLVAHRLVCNYVAIHGGVTRVPLTHDLMKSVMAAKSRYRVHLDEERKRKEAEAQGKKSAHAEEELQDLKVKRDSLRKVIESLGKDADDLAEQAEGKAGSKMAQLLSKSNALRRAAKDKLSQLKVLEDKITTKSAELRSI
ncbi:hypothetical protein ACEWY4_020451 [Coilia grayii]|uniref:Uncharacterized protein n=1 Tax=Coilia grayii TaxID=363190 RepID=A0ABD1JFR4_9TELE